MPRLSGGSRSIGSLATWRPGVVIQATLVVMRHSLQRLLRGPSKGHLTWAGQLQASSRGSSLLRMTARTPLRNEYEPHAPRRAVRDRLKVAGPCAAALLAAGRPHNLTLEPDSELELFL
eukprot:9467867-Pyramimonas_sp.AAC.1